MVFDEFRNNFFEMLKDTDKAVSTADEFINQVKEVFETQESYKLKIKELENKNNDLRDVNMELLMRETGYVENTNEQEQRDTRIAEYKEKLLQGGLF